MKIPNMEEHPMEREVLALADEVDDGERMK